MSSHRKKPFSAKLKKRQLQDKREKKRDVSFGADADDKRAVEDDRQKDDGIRDSGDDVRRINEQPIRKQDVCKGYDPNRYRLHFTSETRKEIDKRKKLASEPYTMLSEISSEVNMADLYPENKPLDIPKRPVWDYTLSTRALSDREEKYFHGYVMDIFSRYRADELSYFEMNLETWRQLWRVLEMSDILLVICDIRFPALHFCPALYRYISQQLHKHVIVVLNKIDLSAPSLVTAWKHYMTSQCPDVHVICFTSFPRDTTSDIKTGSTSSARRKRRFHAVGAMELLNACQRIVQDQVDLSSWREKIHDDAAVGVFDDPVQVENDAPDPAHLSNDYSDYTHYKDGVLTIGCLGYPNVGKSSLLNGLVGKKVVSISKTPGHTKHFQTIFLTNTVKLCDCPGLVFPSLVSKPLQILAGIYPIAQVREPYSVVEYLARRLPLPDMLCLRHPDDESALHEPRRTDLKWSAMDICYAWADKRGFTTAKIARPDAYRAANHLLRMSLDAKLCVSTYPPEYSHKKGYWESHPDTALIAELQTASLARSFTCAQLTDSDSDDDDGILTAEADREEISENEASSVDEVVKSKKKKIVAAKNPFALLGSDSSDDQP